MNFTTPTRHVVFSPSQGKKMAGGQMRGLEPDAERRRRSERARDRSGGRVATSRHSPLTPALSPGAGERGRRTAFGLVLFFIPSIAFADPLASTPVGIATGVEGVVLPAPRVVPRVEDEGDAAVVVRVDAVAPHGSAFRYDFEVLAFEPGTYDLASLFVTEEGAAATGLPALPVEAVPLLPPDRITPHDPEVVGPGWFGGYRLAATGAIVLWLAGLAAILFVGRPKRRAVEDVVVESPRERLDRLVSEAAAGDIPAERHGAVERLVLSCLQYGCGLTDASPRETGERLRDDPEAGPLLERLERWLHRPGASDRDHSAELSALLGDVRSFLDRRADATDEASSATPEPAGVAS